MVARNWTLDLSVSRLQFSDHFLRDNYNLHNCSSRSLLCDPFLQTSAPGNIPSLSGALDFVFCPQKRQTSAGFHLLKLKRNSHFLKPCSVTRPYKRIVSSFLQIKKNLYSYATRKYHLSRNNYKSLCNTELHRSNLTNNEVCDSSLSLKNTMTSIFTVSQNSSSNQNSNPTEEEQNTKEEVLSRNKKNLSSSSSEDKSHSSYYSVSERLKKQNGRNFESETRSKINYPSHSGTKPKSKKLSSAGGSSSDDVFLPLKSKIRHKYGSQALEEGERKHKYNQYLSSESDEHVKESKALETYKLRNSRSKKNVITHDRSSSSSRSRSCSRTRIHRSRGNNSAVTGRSRSNSASRRLSGATAHKPPSSSFHSDVKISSKARSIENVRNQAQNTEVTGLSSSFSTVEHDTFLKRIEEVLSELVEEKKNRILHRVNKNVPIPSASNPVSTSSVEAQRKYEKTNPESRWILSKHYDPTEYKTSSFSHIITAHGNSRLKYRSKSSDLLETHRKCFTKLEPYKPRILRKDPECKLLSEKRIYQNSSTRSKGSPVSRVLKNEKKPLINLRDKPCKIGSDSHRSEGNKSSTTEFNYTSHNTNNNTETDDTCYESDHGGSEEAGESQNDQGGLHSRLLDPAEASVDSAYTGSRGPTPDNPQNLRIKTLEHKLRHRERRLQYKNSQSQECLSEIKSSRLDKSDVDFGEPVVDKIRREIICEIRDVGVYSEYAITTLLQLYRRKYKFVPKKDMDIICKEVRKKFGLWKSDSTLNLTKLSLSPSRKSPKKIQKVQFLRPSELSNTSSSQIQMIPDSYRLPKEALELKETLDKSRKDGSVRWLSREELQEARWAGEVLQNSNILKNTHQILKKATTWNEISEALAIQNDMSPACGHEKNSSKKGCYSADDLIQECQSLLQQEKPIKSFLHNEPFHSNDKNGKDLSISDADKYESVTKPLDGMNMDDHQAGVPRNCSSPENRKDKIFSADSGNLDSPSEGNEISAVDLPHNALQNSQEKNCEQVLDSSNIDSHLNNKDSENNPQKHNSDAQNLEDDNKDLNTGSVLCNETATKMNKESESEDDDFFDTDVSSEATSKNLNKLKKSVSFSTENLVCDIESLDSEVKKQDLNDPRQPNGDMLSEVYINSDAKNSILKNSVTDKKDSSNSTEAPTLGNRNSSSNSNNQSQSIPLDTVKTNSQQDLENGLKPIPSNNATDQLNTEEEEIDVTQSELITKSDEVLNSHTTYSNVAQASSLSHCQMSLGSSLDQPHTSTPNSSGCDQTGSLPSSPTQPSLKGKIAALASAYATRAEEAPDWLIVADEVCKQFNISL